MKSYKDRTKHYGIPVVGLGDRIHPDIEKRKYTIIENLLRAGTEGVSEVVFDDGDYVLEIEGLQATVRLLSSATSPSGAGIVEGFYFNAPSEVRWENLSLSYLWYLYLKATPNTPHENWSVRAVASKMPLGKGSLLMATVDLRESNPAINTNPDGKIYSSDAARHVADDSNPHGRMLHQDEMTVKRLVLPSDSVINVGGQDLPVEGFAAAAAQLSGQRVERMDFMSAGSSGIVVKAPGRVFSVIVQRRVVGGFSGQLGDVGIGYFGEADNVDSEDEFAVYNAGEEGIPLRALVLMG